MSPLEDFMYLINSILLGDEPTIEDFILLVGTIVAFIAFILWCCFPVVPKDSSMIINRHDMKHSPTSKSANDYIITTGSQYNRHHHHHHHHYHHHHHQ